MVRFTCYLMVFYRGKKNHPIHSKQYLTGGWMIVRVVYHSIQWANFKLIGRKGLEHRLCDCPR